MRIVPDDTRIAVISGRGFRGFKGPGLVMGFHLPGRRCVRLRIGDRGDLGAGHTAAFGGARVPVIREGDISAGPVVIRDFAPQSVVVGPPERSRARAGPLKPHYPLVLHALRPPARPGRFWVGLSLLLLLAALFWGGALHAYGHLAVEEAVEQAGAEAAATVVDKWVVGSDTMSPDGVTAYRMRYRFFVRGRAYLGSATLPYDAWSGLRSGGPIRVRYLPEDPRLSLPPGVRNTGSYGMLGTATLVLACLVTAGAVAMTVRRLRGR
jgi:hypothetical protein